MDNLARASTQLLNLVQRRILDLSGRTIGELKKTFFPPLSPAIYFVMIYLRPLSLRPLSTAEGHRPRSALRPRLNDPQSQYLTAAAQLNPFSSRA